MTVALDRLATSFADGVFKRGDRLLLRCGGAGHVENFFLQDCSVEIVDTVTQRDLRKRQSKADPIRRQVVDIVEVNTAHREIAQLLECGGTLDLSQNAVGVRRFECKRNKPSKTAGLILQLPQLAQMVKTELGYKYHWAVADYLQRSARHIASQTDVDQAYALGQAAVEYALRGDNAIMPCIVRGKGKRYSWSIGEAPLSEVANREKKMPRSYITRDGFGITAAAREYLAPLVQGEAYPQYRKGMPVYVRLKNTLVPRKLKERFKV